MNRNNPSTCTVPDYKCKCFDALNAEELNLISKNEVIVKYKKGEAICKQGTFASHIMVMKKGLAKVFIEGENDSLI